MTFLWPAMTAVALFGVIAAWAVLTGVAKISLAIWLRRQVSGGWPLVLSGLLSLGFGMLLFARPTAGALAVATIIAAYALALGALLLGLGIQLKRWQPDREPSLHQASAPLV